VNSKRKAREKEGETVKSAISVSQVHLPITQPLFDVTARQCRIFGSKKALKINLLRTSTSAEENWESEYKLIVQ